MIDLAVVQPPDPDLSGYQGFVHRLLVTPEAIYAIGGSYHRPVLLCSTDRGHSFARWNTPQTPGLRNICVVEDAVWIIGEYGLFAITTDGGATWERREFPKGTRGTDCLYSIVRDASGRFWICGDEGLVLRSKTRAGKTFATLPTRTTGRMLHMYIDPETDRPWLLDTTGMVQRFTGTKFVEVGVPALEKKQGLTAIVRTPSKAFVVIGDGGVLLRSDTGSKWKRISSGTRRALTSIAVTKFGIFAVGFEGVILVSHDDGRTFMRVGVKTTTRLWSVAEVGNTVLIGGDHEVVYRIETPALATLLHDAFVERDPTIAALALHVRDGHTGADLVLEDALRERGYY